MAMQTASSLESRVSAIGRDILDRAAHHRRRVLPRAGSDQLLMHRLMNEPRLRVQVLRFVDTLPVLTDDELARPVTECFIAFTGSLAAGCRINELVVDVHEKQHHVKRIIAEMGGKNALIVDASADMDEPVQTAAVSAFGYAGQKCSVASRAIVVGDAYDTVRRTAYRSDALAEGRPAASPWFILYDLLLPGDDSGGVDVACDPTMLWS